MAKSQDRNETAIRDAQASANQPPGGSMEAGADLGGIAAALNLLVPIPIAILVPILGAGICCLQVWGSYKMLRNIFRVLALALLAYVPAAILARPDWGAILKRTLIPSIHFNREFLSMVVAVIGTTLSAYFLSEAASPRLPGSPPAFSRPL
jgi:Mn2+/Fe2+ NRAMP family transporter